MLSFKSPLVLKQTLTSLSVLSATEGLTLSRPAVEARWGCDFLARSSCRLKSGVRSTGRQPSLPRHSGCPRLLGIPGGLTDRRKGNGSRVTCLEEAPSCSSGISASTSPGRPESPKAPRVLSQHDFQTSTSTAFALADSLTIIHKVASQAWHLLTQRLSSLTQDTSSRDRRD